MRARVSHRARAFYPMTDLELSYAVRVRVNGVAAGC
jgi:hypothetical protein